MATLAWNDFRHLELFYAVACSGRILHTVNPRLLPEQIAWIINDAGATLLFAATEFAPLLAKLTPHLPSRDDDRLHDGRRAHAGGTAGAAAGGGPVLRTAAGG